MIRRRDFGRHERGELGEAGERVKSYDGKIVKMSLDETKQRYASGEIYPVYDTGTNEGYWISRDGYYPPDKLEPLVSMEGYVKEVFEKLEEVERDGK